MDWHYDETTAYWANRILIPVKLPIQPQYDGLDYHLWEVNLKKHILKSRFPDYCRFPVQHESLLCSLANSIKCFQDHYALEALVLVVAWGRKTRSKGNIYQKSRRVIEETLLECLLMIEEKNRVEDVWRLSRDCL